MRSNMRALSVRIALNVNLRCISYRMRFFSWDANFTSEKAI